MGSTECLVFAIGGHGWKRFGFAVLMNTMLADHVCVCRRPRYSNENKYERRDKEGDRNEDRQNSRVFVNRQNERYQQDGEERYPRDRNERSSWDREDQNRKFRRRPYEDRNRDRNDWESSKHSRDFIEQETEDKPSQYTRYIVNFIHCFTNYALL